MPAPPNDHCSADSTVVSFRKKLSAQLHLKAKRDGVSPRRLYEAGLAEFLKHDVTKTDSDHSVGRKALCDFMIETDGSWSGIRMTITSGVIGFMLEHGYAAPTGVQIRELEALTKKYPASVEPLGEWFDRAFPPAVIAEVEPSVPISVRPATLSSPSTDPAQPHASDSDK